MLRIVCISDLHGHLPEIPECDILLISGDICPVREHNLFFQELWLRTNFATWRTAQPAKHCIFCAGNHDFVFEKMQGGYGHNVVDCGMYNNPTYMRYLQDSGVECCGLKIWGSPWQRPFGGWAFNMPEADMQKKWERVPDVDIVISHGPPYGYGDVGENNEDLGTVYPARSGSESFTRYIRLAQPKLVVYGHIHHGYGKYKIDNSHLVNASYVNDYYQPVNLPWLVILDDNRKVISAEPVPLRSSPARLATSR
jgi:predicted phosphodiesterase